MANNKYRDTAIVIAFPDNWAKGEKLRDRLLVSLNITYTPYYKVGHAALILIQKKSGLVEYFDYGRYISPPKKGRVRSKDTDPKLYIPVQASFDKSGNVTNAFEIMHYLASIKEATHGHGTTYFSICRDIDFERGKAFVNESIKKGSIPYVTWGAKGMNCSSFVVKTLLQALRPGIKRKKLTLSLLSAPTPLANVYTASDKGSVWRLKDRKIERIYLDRLRVLKMSWRNLKLSLRKNKHLLNTINVFEKHGDHAPIQLPGKAQFLESLGESCWMHIYRESQLEPDHFIIESYSENHTLNYSILAKLQEGCLRLDAPYEFDYVCNKLITTLIQDNKRCTLSFVGYTPRHHVYYPNNNLFHTKQQQL